MTYHSFPGTNDVSGHVYMLPHRPEDAGLALKCGGVTIRIEFTEETATRLADSLQRWYASRDSERVAPDEWVATDITGG